MQGLSEPMWFGDRVPDTLAFVLGSAGWMLEGLGEDERRRAVDALQALLRLIKDRTASRSARPAGSSPPTGARDGAWLCRREVARAGHGQRRRERPSVVEDTTARAHRRAM